MYSPQTVRIFSCVSTVYKIEQRVKVILLVIALTVSLEAYSWMLWLEKRSLTNIAVWTDVLRSLKPIKSSTTCTQPACATALLFDLLYITRFCKAYIATIFISSVGWSSRTLTSARQPETTSFEQGPHSEIDHQEPRSPTTVLAELEFV